MKKQSNYFNFIYNHQLFKSKFRTKIEFLLKDLSIKVLRVEPIKILITYYYFVESKIKFK